MKTTTWPKTASEEHGLRLRDHTMLCKLQDTLEAPARQTVDDTEMCYGVKAGTTAER